jgi:hypothetical protein
MLALVMTMTNVLQMCWIQLLDYAVISQNLALKVKAVIQ